MQEKQYVIFKLAEEEYGVEIVTVQEIIRPPKMVKLPNAPPYILGVINLRGSIIPVVDLKDRLKIGVTEIDDNTRSIIVKIENQSYGILVDAVVEVFSLNSEQIERGKDFHNYIDPEFIKGIARLDKRMIILLSLPCQI
jgi:purine-binding chemotaxis protein CheW